MNDQDLDYYERRAAEERLAAERAANQSAMQAHRKLADCYAAIAGIGRSLNKPGAGR